MIYLLAVIKAKPGMRDSILTAFKANVPAVLAEDGCIEYAAVLDASPAPAFQTPYGPDTFVVVEKWASPEALLAHSTAPHMAAYGARTREWIAERTLHVLTAA